MSRAAGVLVGAYYLAFVAVGLISLRYGVPPPAGHVVGDVWARILFGGTHVLLGSAAFGCRVWGFRRGEATALAFLGLYAALHALMLVAGGSIVAGARLGIDPLIMWAYALRRARSVVSQGDGRGAVVWRTHGG